LLTAFTEKTPMPADRQYEYRPLQPDEVDALTAILLQAFHGSRERSRQWIELLGAEAHRVVRVGGEIAGALRIIRMGQWFGGQSVPAAGIAAVAVPPEYRGGGAATALLRSLLDELRAEGMALSVLYPTAATLYRRAGYELAGVKTTYEAPADAIQVQDRRLEIVRVDAGDYDDLRQCYAQRARTTAGNLDRPEFVWSRILDERDQPVYRYRARNGERTEGYFVFTQEGWGKAARVQDVCVLTREAGLRLLTLFADHRATVGSFVWSGGPEDPLLHLLPETKNKEARTWMWMTRIVDVVAALSARGYPAGLEAELHFQIDDDWLAWNRGRFILEVANGRGVARPGGQGRIRLDVRHLAQLYTGHLAPPALQTLGAIDGPEADLSLAGLVFSGPRPFMLDIF